MSCVCAKGQTLLTSEGYCWLVISVEGEKCTLMSGETGSMVDALIEAASPYDGQTGLRVTVIDTGEYAMITFLPKTRTLTCSWELDLSDLWEPSPPWAPREKT